MRFALFAVSLSCAFSWQAAVAPRPTVRHALPRPAPAVAMAMEYDKLRETLLPADNKDTFRNALGLQPFVWGVYSTIKPAQSASMFLGVTVLNGLSLTLFKLVAMMHIVTGAQMCRDEESKAATTGMLLFAGWAVLLRSAVAAGTLGAVARTSGWWCTAMALTAARRLGFSTSGLIFAGSWTSLLQTSLFTKVFALPVLPFLISREIPKAAPKAAAKPAGKAAPTKQGNIVPTRPAPPGYRYDSFGTLIVSDA